MSTGWPRPFRAAPRPTPPGRSASSAMATCPRRPRPADGGGVLHGSGARPKPTKALQATAAVHGYTTAFWWTAGIFAIGAVVCGSLLRRGPLAGQAETAPLRIGARPEEPA